MVMTLADVMLQLEKFGNPNTKKVLLKHGAQEPFFGVKVGDLKVIVKQIKKDHELAMQLYSTGNSDAMYLAGLIADEKCITRQQLNTWVANAYWYMLSDYTVAWVAAESDHGYDLGMEWVQNTEEFIASAGWSTLANLALVKADEELELDVFRNLLEKIPDEIKTAQNRVRYSMNAFVISVGSSVKPLNGLARKVARRLGTVEVEMGGTSCKVPDAISYLDKVEKMGRLGKKKKKARC